MYNLAIWVSNWGILGAYFYVISVSLIWNLECVSYLGVLFGIVGAYFYVISLSLIWNLVCVSYLGVLFGVLWKHIFTLFL